MLTLLSSPRRRRRIAGWGTVAAIVAGTTFSLIHWSNTAHQARETFSGGPAYVPEPPPTAAPFARARREGVLKTASRFVETAVARRHVGESWELTAPSLRIGYTKRTWAQANIPVQPYPVDGARWDVDYSWKDTVGLKVALFPKRGVDVPAAVFDMQLHAFGKGKNRRWLVDSWTPTSYQGIPAGPLGSARSRPPVVVKARLGPAWLFVPLGVFALLLLALTLYLSRDWWSGRRADRRYRTGSP